MRRVVVIGGSGFFGGLIVEKLRAAGHQVLSAGRLRGDLSLDVEDASSLHRALQSRDLVIDAAGPFQNRSLTLIQAATRIGFDVIDLSDSVEYARKVFTLELPINASGVRVLTSCSSLSTISAAVVRASGVEKPICLSAFLAPASRFTANRATTASLLASVAAGGWRETRMFDFPDPVGTRRGYGVESVDAVTLPRIWPSLQTVEFFIDTQVPGVNSALRVAARSPAVLRLLRKFQPLGLPMSRLLGSSWGVLGYDIDGVSRWALTAPRRGYLTAIVPAVLAARAIAEGTFTTNGLVPPDRHVDASELFQQLEREGIEILSPSR